MAEQIVTLALYSNCMEIYCLPDQRFLLKRFVHISPQVVIYMHIFSKSRSVLICNGMCCVTLGSTFLGFWILELALRTRTSESWSLERSVLLDLLGPVLSLRTTGDRLLQTPLRELQRHIFDTVLRLSTVLPIKFIRNRYLENKSANHKMVLNIF